MKSVSMIISIALFALLLTNAHAGDRYARGVIPGSGQGAIAGQAIGHGTKSTFAGASVGGVWGVIIGNELDKQHGAVNQHSQVIAHSQRFDNRRHDNRYDRPRPVFKDHYRNYYRNEFRRDFRNDHKRDFPRYRHDRPNCRKFITIQKGYYGTKRIISTICDNNPRYKFQKTNPFKSHDRFRR
jgi:hypothetical protein